ncbi:SRPBCC family protein [Pseudarthrobacter sp. S9]|uniref:SRPBCC family protein n=1 Tax=Pseudarthrobacter sp. S9 TaxID=3418421 RepID=UPI003D08C284
MNDRDLTTTFSVDQTPEQAFDAINDVRGWWSGEIEGSTDKLGDEFTYRVPDIHFSKFRITELVPAKKVAWLVLESYLNFTEDKEEWTGTTVNFELFEQDGGTQVRFTHAGLVPEYECYDVCSNAWGEYVNGSLRNLITTGAGRPNSFEGDEAIEAVRAKEDGH